jgi:hypothetical protein
MVLPFIEQRPLYDGIAFTHGYYATTGSTHPDPQPLVIARTRLAAFMCPSDQPFPSTTDLGTCNYGVSVGSNLGYSGSGFSEIRNNGMFRRRVETPFAEVIDGLANTIMLGEFVVADNTGSIYTPGGDMVRGIAFPNLPAEFENPTDATLVAYGQACLAGIANHTSAAGQTWAAPSMYDSAINTIATPNWMWPTCHICAGCGKGDGGGVFPARSKHPGGALHAFGDASVHFITDGVNLAVYQGLGTRAGSEPVSVP